MWLEATQSAPELLAASAHIHACSCGLKRHSFTDSRALSDQQREQMLTRDCPEGTRQSCVVQQLTGIGRVAMNECCICG